MRRADGQPVTVLVVDDEPVLAEMVSMALRYEGWNITTAGDGSSAIAAARRQRPDVVVLDVMLPDMSGLDVLHKLRSENPGLPVLLLTAKDAVEDRIAGLTAGGDDYVTKPFSIEEVVLRLRALLRRTGPGTEAPAEMHFYFPRFRALCMAENATHNLHNLLTLRGALVRDPRAWSGYLTEAIDTFADRTDVVFASHHWPTWGREKIVEFLSQQRDMYSYLHDQTLRLLNQGYTGVEIAEMFQLPPALQRAWHTHGYYGSVSHNVKAIYQRYMGWFDGNPGWLWPHPPEALAPRYVDALGGIDRVLELAREAFDAGDFRWAATLLDHAVFADSEHAAARGLYADTLEQLAYGAECATWRNFFLTGAAELRDGNPGSSGQVPAPTFFAQLTPDQIFDVLAISINGPRAWDLDLAIDFTFTEPDVNYRLTLRNGVLIHRKLPADPATANATVTVGDKVRLVAAALGDISSPGFEVFGDRTVLQTFLSVLDRPDSAFNIVTP